MIRIDRILFIVCVGISLFSKAQDPISKVYDEESGLPSNSVYDLHKGSDGKMYLGTDLGFCSFDGSVFTSFRAENQLGTAVTNLFEDFKGRIWCSNFNHQLFLFEDNILREVDLGISADELKGHYKLTMSDSLLFVFTFNSCYAYNLNNETIISDFPSEFWPCHDNGVRKVLMDIYSDTSGYFFLFKDHIVKLNSNSEAKRVNVRHEDNYFLLESNGENLVLFDRSRFNGVSVDRKNLESSALFGSDVEESSMSILSSGYTVDGLWCCTTEGVFNVSQGGELEIYYKNYQISDVANDAEGNTWFSTLHSGVFVVPNLEFRILNSSNSALDDEQLSAISFFDDTIYLGTQNGVVYTLRENIVEHSANAGVSKEVVGFAKDPKGQVLAVGDRVFYPSNSSLKFGKYDRFYKSLKWWDSKELCFVESGQFYVSSYSSDRVFTGPKSDFFKEAMSWDQSNSYRLSFPVNGVRSFELDTLNQLVYLNTTSGLFMYNGDTINEIKYNDSISVVGVSSFSDEQTFISTVNLGVLEVYQGQIRNRYLDSLSVKLVKKFENELWYTTEKGIHKLSNGVVENLSKSSGLIYSRIHDFISFEGYVYLASNNGLISIPLQERFNNAPIPILSEIKVTDLYGNQSSSNVFPSEIKNLNISFDCYAVFGREETMVYYRLTRNDQDVWQEASIDQGSISLLGLSSGDYSIELKVKDSQGNFGDTIVVEFSIETPFWQTGWFIISIALLLLTVLVLTWKVRVRQLNKRSSLESELRISQLTAIKAQMNPHFVFNALNSIQEYVLLHQTELANDYLGKFARLMRKTLDLSNETEILLGEELELLALYLELEAIRFEENFEYSLEVSESLKSRQHNLSIPSMIIQPYVENAIKHGLLHKRGVKKLLIRVSEEIGSIKVSIVDNGIGVEASSKINEARRANHRSFGTSAIQKRLDLLNEDWPSDIKVNIKTSPNTGTSVQIVIPLKD